jgi:hypothetical protein
MSERITEAHTTHRDAGTASTPDEDDWHRLLAEDRRRVTLHVLADESTPIDLDALATAVADREGPSTGDSLYHLTASLHHCHLPKMDSLGVLDYDAESHQVDS